MKCKYNDILSRISEDPLWYDENGTPRYCKFHPREASNIYASEVALIEISCQECGTPYNVAISCQYPHEPLLSTRIPKLHYGDSPCWQSYCLAGATMSSNSLRVLEFWKRDNGKGWYRDTYHEILLIDHPNFK